MIIDSSAIVALVRREPAAVNVLDVIAKAADVRVAAPVWLETSIVLMGQRSGLNLDQVEQVRQQLGLQLVPFDGVHADAAHSAWLRFGKGRHPAGLNILDCMSYAAAMVADEPLLFVGDDFAQTDVLRAA